MPAVSASSGLMATASAASQLDARVRGLEIREEFVKAIELAYQQKLSAPVPQNEEADLISRGLDRLDFLRRELEPPDDADERRSSIGKNLDSMRDGRTLYQNTPTTTNHTKPTSLGSRSAINPETIKSPSTVKREGIVKIITLARGGRYSG